MTHEEHVAWFQKYEPKAREFYNRVITDTMTEADFTLWDREGHLLIHWLRETIIGNAPAPKRRRRNR